MRKGSTGLLISSLRSTRKTGQWEGLRRWRLRMGHWFSPPLHLPSRLHLQRRLINYFRPMPYLTFFSERKLGLIFYSQSRSVSLDSLDNSRKCVRKCKITERVVLLVLHLSCKMRQKCLIGCVNRFLHFTSRTLTVRQRRGVGECLKKITKEIETIKDIIIFWV